MTAGPWLFTTAGRADFINGVFNLETDTFHLALFLSTSNLSEASTTYAGLTDEHAEQFGYTTGGLEIGPIVVAGSTIRLADGATMPTWTASGGDITARSAVIYKVGGKVLCYCLLDATPDDVTATDGTDLVPPDLWLLSLAPFALPSEERPRKRNRKRRRAEAVLEDIEATVRSVRKPADVPAPAEPAVVAPVPAEDLSAIRAKEAKAHEALAELARAKVYESHLAELRHLSEQMKDRQRRDAKRLKQEAWERMLAEEDELLLLS